MSGVTAFRKSNQRHTWKILSLASGALSLNDSIHSDRKRFTSQHWVHWAMNIFYESANECHGFMPRSVYDNLRGVESPADDAGYMYMPEDEFIARVNSHRPVLDFNALVEDAKKHAPVGMPWIQKVRYLSVLSNQKDLNPRLFGDVRSVHIGRKTLLARWLDAMTPYYTNWHIFSFAEKPMLNGSMVKLQLSVHIIGERDMAMGGDGFEFGVDRIRELAAIKRAKE